MRSPALSLPPFPVAEVAEPSICWDHGRATFGRGFIHGAPDLAVEIVSQDRSLAELTTKAREYIEAGTLLVWVVDPPTRTVRVHQPGLSVVTLSRDDTLDGGEILPGFTLPLSRLFAEVE